jgi:hypothetical protein
MRTRVLGLAAVVAAATLLSPGLAGAAAPPSPELISVNTAGLGGNANSGDLVGDLSVSGNGRYVVFDSYASDLVPNDTNGTLDVFVRDRKTGMTSLVDLDSNGQQGTSFSDLPRISDNGRYIAFISGSALVADDTNGAPDVYVRDLTTGTTTRVSDAPDGGQLSQGVNSSDPPSISSNGRYVAYDSYSPELSGVTDQSLDAIAITDRDSDGNGIYDEPGGTTTTVVTPDGVLGSMSLNGRYVGYASSVSGSLQTYVVDRGKLTSGAFTGSPTTTLVSALPDGTPGNGNNGPGYVSNVGDVAFWSTSTNIGGVAGNPDVLVRDHTGAISVVGASISNQPAITSDGKYVAFDTDSGTDSVYVTDRTTSTTQIVSVDPNGNPVEGSGPSISSNGDYVAFGSIPAAGLPPGSPDNYNVFLSDLNVTGSAVTTQTITFNKPASVAYSPGGQVMVSASATSGLPVSFSSTSTTCSVTATGVVTIDSAGSCNVDASQAGNASYSAAADVTRTLTITKASATVGLAPVATQQLGETTALEVTGDGASTAVKLSASPASVCTVATQSVIAKAVGTCTITAQQPGDANYLTSPAVFISFSISYVTASLATVNTSAQTATLTVHLSDTTGKNEGAAKEAVTALTIDGVAFPTGNGTSPFTYVAPNKSYSLTISTAGLLSGPHDVTYQASGDPVPHDIAFST